MKTTREKASIFKSRTSLRGGGGNCDKIFNLTPDKNNSKQAPIKAKNKDESLVGLRKIYNKKIIKSLSVMSGPFDRSPVPPANIPSAPSAKTRRPFCRRRRPPSLCPLLCSGAAPASAGCSPLSFSLSSPSSPPL